MVNEFSRPVITISTICRNFTTNNNFNHLQKRDKKMRCSSERQVRAIMRSGVHRGSGITVPQLRIREYERLEESRTKVSDFSEAKISSLGRDRIFSNHQLFLISLS